MRSLFATIGLEVHVQLNTLTKMFCGCAVAFGGEPNSRVCEVCLGHPGSLPVPNETAIEYTTKIALALGCEVAPRSIFHRKNYFYPDMPKNYQISQYDSPIGTRGSIEIDGVVVGIERVHLEEDTGKSLHQGAGGRIHDAEYSLEDFNRAGTPLVEIVTTPSIPSADAARAFATELRSIMEFLGVSDVKMEEGSMRVDANISIAPASERGVKIEVKNMNSLRSVHRALTFEIKRQSEALSAGKPLEQSTRHWDEKAGATKALRTKEEAFDYRYFPEPDLLPIEPSVEWLRQLRDEIPELPAQRRRRFVEMGVSEADALVLTGTLSSADFFERACDAAKIADAKQMANWIVNSASLNITAEHVARIADLVAGGTISRNQGKEVLAAVVDKEGSPDEIVARKGLSAGAEDEAVLKAIAAAIASNPDVASRIATGEDKAFGFLVGQVMKELRGKGDPSTVGALLRKRLRP